MDKKEYCVTVWKQLVSTKNQQDKDVIERQEQLRNCAKDLGDIVQEEFVFTKMKKKEVYTRVPLARLGDIWYMRGYFICKAKNPKDAIYTLKEANDALNMKKETLSQETLSQKSK